MVEYRERELDRTFAALSHSARRTILARLRKRSATVTALAEPFGMSLNAVSKHLRVLEQAGLIHRDISGREHRCSLRAVPLRQATAWMNEYRIFWQARRGGGRRSAAAARP